jgi:selenocysteine lyase/cysteine desulfurase
MSLLALPGTCDLSDMESTPFTTIESAAEFLQLLAFEIEKVQAEMQRMLTDDRSLPRREEALRLVIHKLNQLESYMRASLHLLHDLRTLRDLLLK